MMRIGLPLVLLATLAACSTPPPQPNDVIAVLESFYGAMETGDTTAAMSRIAPDAVFVESGRLETRDEYEKNHLPADIAFEKDATGKRGAWDVKFSGDTAWAIVSTEYEGDGVPVPFVSSQLAVLTRDDDGQWWIRSVHWSSRRR